MWSSWTRCKLIYRASQSSPEEFLVDGKNIYPFLQKIILMYTPNSSPIEIGLIIEARSSAIRNAFNELFRTHPNEEQLDDERRALLKQLRKEQFHTTIFNEINTYKENSESREIIKQHVPEFAEFSFEFEFMNEKVVEMLKDAKEQILKTDEQHARELINSILRQIDDVKPEVIKDANAARRRNEK